MHVCPSLPRKSLREKKRLLVGSEAGLADEALLQTGQLFLHPLIPRLIARELQSRFIAEHSSWLRHPSGCLAFLSKHPLGLSQCVLQIIHNPLLSLGDHEIIMANLDGDLTVRNQMDASPIG